MDKSEDGSLRVDVLCSLYRRVFNVSLSIDDVCMHMKGIVQVCAAFFISYSRCVFVAVCFRYVHLKGSVLLTGSMDV